MNDLEKTIMHLDLNISDYSNKEITTINEKENVSKERKKAQVKLDKYVSKVKRLNEELSEWNIDILSYRVSLKDMMDCQLNENTEEVLKQVYFPLGNNEYKILTVMSPSSILVKLGNKLKKIGYDSRECRNDKSERYGEDHCMIFNQSKVGFGGTKPQNISTLNSKAGGSFYMLESLPPKWKHIDRLPKINFFDEMIYRKRATFAAPHPRY